MTSSRALTLGVAVLGLIGACYSGKDDVPRMSSYGALTTGSGGHGGDTSASSSTNGQGANGGMGGSGGSADPCANTFFCDDFEAHATGAPPGGMWENNQSGGTVAVDTGRAKSGKNAVKISADAATGYRSAMISLYDPALLPVDGNVIYGRMMFYLESAPTGTVHWTIIDGTGPVVGQGYHAAYRYGGQHPVTDANDTFVGSQMMANYETPDAYQDPPVGPSSDCWLHADQKVVPVGAWSCAEWLFDGPNNTMRFWLNGQEIPDLAMTGKGQGCVSQAADFVWQAPNFERIDLGFESYQADDARVLWIDDVALGTQRLGCPK
ncbi:secreted hydrolase [Minicystis rosea]|nr:secreted hydrolase [Minicystis rosea]